MVPRPPGGDEFLDTHERGTTLVRARTSDEFWERYREVVVFLFTVGPAVSSLAGWTQGTAEKLLRLLAVISGVYLIYRLVILYRISRADGLELWRPRPYMQAIERLCDRQVALFDEEVRTEIVVGRNDAEDVVSQETSTTPTPLMTQRLIRPIAPFHLRRPARLSKIKFSCQVNEGDDGPVSVTTLPILNTAGYLRVLLLFEPALTKKTRWTLRYQPHGLWRELRKNNRDILIWNDRFPFNGRSSMTDFRVRFVFKDPKFKPNVEEQNGQGEILSRNQMVTGEWVIEWNDPHPQGYRYEWQITRVPV